VPRLNGRDRVRTATSIWRAWRGPQQARLVAAAVVAVHLWSGPIDVPGREDVAETIWPLTSAFVAMACLTGARLAHTDGVRLSPRGAVQLRAGYLAVLTCSASAAVLVTSSSAGDRTVLARNDAMLCGISLAAVELLPPAIGWTPLVLIPMLTWLLGSNGGGVAPEPWAVLLHPAGSPAARTTAAGLLLIGTVVYLGQAARPELKRARRRRADRRNADRNRRPRLGRRVRDPITRLRGARSGR
jgi:hypothetical protein